VTVARRSDLGTVVSTGDDVMQAIEALRCPDCRCIHNPISNGDVT